MSHNPAFVFSHDYDAETVASRNSLRSRGSSNYSQTPRAEGDFVWAV